MGIDLTVCPHRYQRSGLSWILAYDRLGLDRDYRIFEQIDGFSQAEGHAVRAHPLPPTTRFDWYGDEGIHGDMKDDAYGNALTYALAAEFGRVTIPENTTDWNKGVLALLAKLPPETMVVLYWH